MAQFSRTITFGLEQDLADADASGNPLLAGKTYLAERLVPDAAGEVLYPGFEETLTFGVPEGSIPSAYFRYNRNLSFQSTLIPHHDGSQTHLDEEDGPRSRMSFVFQYIDATALGYLERFYRKVVDRQIFQFTNHLGTIFSVRWTGGFSPVEHPAGFVEDESFDLAINLEEVRE